MRPSQLPMTANLALRAGVLRETGPFRTDLGRFGHRLTGSEDHELARRVWGAGYTIWYSPPAGLRHQIPASRLTFRYAFKMAFDSARSRVIEKTTAPGHGVGWLLSRLVTYALHVLWCGLLSLLSLVIFQTGWSKRWLTRAAKGAGYVAECCCAVGRKFRGAPPPT